MTCALEICGKNKMQALLLGLDKIFILHFQAIRRWEEEKIPTKGIPFNLTESLILTTKNVRKVQQTAMRTDM